VRWGTTLHDRFMLPHFVWEDFLGRARPNSAVRLRFRSGMVSRRSSNSAFPFGAVDHGGVKLELRQALEPWHVLGEEGSAGGTVRYVDSSVERLQVKARGLSRAATSSPATAGACR
jgi:uncharacterized protein (DUF2126 family)